ncbi:alpha-hydroxy acid oxidase [Brachybacterium sacelli]|uniref:L-lactate dehydrogenase (Cytochrome) n=1 Tax=Brachybacterium sacelli TaxID=173364 RepID=A0ABS4WXM1_9MICO|nr:alpha-hydroxy acid oxidase [Brachybacterium sacelli]MBP2380896.1 L-lactate dehydrogenase (cytochrome) [Brachybacterium sacelli]
MTADSTLSGALEFAKMLAAGGFRLDPVASAPSIEDIRRLAKKRLPTMAFDIIDGASNHEITLDANTRDLRDVRFRPRWLTDISHIDTSVAVGGTTLPRPYVLGPLGLQRMIGGEGELGAVRAAGKANIPFTVSTASNWSMEELADEATGPLWYQLYMYKSDQIVSRLISRAKAIGAEALVVTVDVPLNGKRYRDHRNGMSIPPKITPRNAVQAIRHLDWTRAIMRPPTIGFRNLAGEIQGDNAVSHQEFVAKYLANLTLTWENIADVRRQFDGPLYIKGILTPEDAVRARSVGAQGIYVSNHGGRQLDSSPSTISVLPSIVDAVGEDMTVVFDSGVRTGDDIAKALAVGADLVSIGRAWGYGNAAAGEKGVLRVLEILDEELELAMGQLGATSIGALDRSFVDYPEAWHGAGLHRVPEPEQAIQPTGPTPPTEEPAP